MVHAGGDVLSRCVTAKHVTLQHMSHFISGHIREIPATGNRTQIHKDEKNSLSGLVLQNTHGIFNKFIYTKHVSFCNLDTNR